MSDISPRAGGRILPATAYVSVDGTTIAGSGVPGNPLRAIGQSNPVLERVTGSPAEFAVGVPVSPTVPLSIVKGNGNSPQNVTLAAGDEDGFQKTVLFNNGTNVGPDYYHLSFETNPQQDYSYIKFGTAGGGIILVWDDANGWWLIVATFAGDPTA